MVKSKQTQCANAHGHKPKAVDWAGAYCAALAETCHCGRAAEAAGVVYSTVWRRRKADPEFEAAYQDALKQGATQLEAEAVRRARDGLRRLKFNPKTGEAYLDPDTGKPYVEHEYSDQLLIALLKRHFPDQYRERQAIEHSGEINSQVTVSVAEQQRLQAMYRKIRLAAFGELEQQPPAESGQSIPRDEASGGQS